MRNNILQDARESNPETRIGSQHALDFGGYLLHDGVAADFQYLFGKDKGLVYVYPTAGVYVEQFHEVFNVGAQAGLGVELQFSDKSGVFGEGGYQYLFLDKAAGRTKFNLGAKIAF